MISYLNYGILAWGNCTSININRLFRLQKWALRIINFTDYIAHTDPLFFKYRSLKTKDIYYHQLGYLIMYQSISITLPSSINSIFTRNFEIHTHSTRQALHFHLPLTCTSFAKKTINYEGPKLCYSLQSFADLKSCPLSVLVLLLLLLLLLSVFVCPICVVLSV